MAGLTTRGAPPPRVLAAFGAPGTEPRALDGGQGDAWRAGDVVLKPLDMLAEALRWQADVLGRVDPADVRMAVPLRALDGRLVVEGWTARPFLRGARAERWADVVAAGERLHSALADLERPAFLDARDDPWARADRVAWGDATATAIPEIDRLLDLREPVAMREQVVHGDLSGNVLFARGLPPAVIDFSPYWRPAPYASAVVRVDAALWYGAPLTEADPQLLLRALLFRLLSTADPAAAAREHRATVEIVVRRATDARLQG